ncbi:TrmH family RNA methyltransferase [Streptomyces oceani]|uniref:rRNA methyltransferase n=1 Tax=Streptomyces oceani TaxID=1075402 RepID=A0A1E7JX27_9ACTN|nr:TrmH family RNA methyltransferase [Streptomyces oceani]OEU96157.1 rRNA methyltransferase [Streptomyces oceani]
MLRWRELAGETVLLDGFHVLKHALRFGAGVPLALAEQPAATLRLATELAPDLVDTLGGLLREVPPDTLRQLVPRPHPTGVAALAVPAGVAVPGETSVRDDAGHPGAPRGSDSSIQPDGPLRSGGPDGVDSRARPRTAPLVVLDNPRHLGNIGAVVRLVAGCGADGVLTTGSVDPWHPSVLRASAGLHFATAVARRAPAELPPGPLYGLDPAGTDLRSLVLPNDALLAFGSERHGLSDELRARADQLVSLPMRPQVSSFNLATSVAMTLYHWMAQSSGSA